MLLQNKLINKREILMKSLNILTLILFSALLIVSCGGGGTENQDIPDPAYNIVRVDLSKSNSLAILDDRNNNAENKSKLVSNENFNDIAFYDFNNEIIPSDDISVTELVDLNKDYIGLTVLANLRLDIGSGIAGWSILVRKSDGKAYRLPLGDWGFVNYGNWDEYLSGLASFAKDHYEPGRPNIGTNNLYIRGYMDFQDTAFGVIEVDLSRPENDTIRVTKISHPNDSVRENNFFVDAKGNIFYYASNLSSGSLRVVTKDGLIGTYNGKYVPIYVGTTGNVYAKHIEVDPDEEVPSKWVEFIVNIDATVTENPVSLEEEPPRFDTKIIKYDRKFIGLTRRLDPVAQRIMPSYYLYDISARSLEYRNIPLLDAENDKSLNLNWLYRSQSYIWVAFQNGNGLVTSIKRIDVESNEAETITIDPSKRELMLQNLSIRDNNTVNVEVLELPAGKEITLLIDIYGNETAINSSEFIRDVIYINPIN